MADLPRDRTRRRTDGDGNEAQRAAYRLIAERAYELYLASGCDSTRALEHWVAAEQELVPQPWPRS